MNGLVVAILVLFVGTDLTACIIGKIEKCNKFLKINPLSSDWNHKISLLLSLLLLQMNSRKIK